MRLPCPDPVAAWTHRRCVINVCRELRTADYQYELPPELIAQQPALERDGSRLFVLHRATGNWEHRRFRDILEFLRPGDCLILNDSRVIPARLRAVKESGGGAVEVFLTEEVASNCWWALARPAKRLRPGARVRLLDRHGLDAGVSAEVLGKNEDGHVQFRFDGPADIRPRLPELGDTPLPPYIERPSGASTEDLHRYQTVFAAREGSVAAPTAGLHFTETLLAEAERRGVELAKVTLHVGLGTFAPVKTERIEDHRMHREWYEIPPSTARAIERAKAAGGRIWAVGTTALRTLESSAAQHGQLVPGQGETRLFVHPPYRFRVVDALLTNFHLPESTLLMLISAFAAPGETSGRDLILRAYAEAIRERYRFFSYGDAMLIL